MQTTDFVPIVIVSAIIGALVSSFFNHRLLVAREQRKVKETRERHFAALRAEIDYCARLATTYAKGTVSAPLYRFPATVYQTVYATLVGGGLPDTDISALTGFYSQVDQMNRGLDAVERYRAADDEGNAKIEFKRLILKALEMRHPAESSEAPVASGFILRPGPSWTIISDYEVGARRESFTSCRKFP